MADALDLFAGGGGVACAMRELGLDARHVELEPRACATLTAAGFGDVVQADVRDIAKWKPAKRPAVMWGSPPCPLFSSLNQLEHRKAVAVNGWPWFMDGIRACDPWTVVAEITRHAPVVLWKRDLESLGYHTTTWLLDAAEYGEAQTRTRWIVIGSRVRAATPPPATHGFPFLGLPPYRTLREILDPVGKRKVYASGLGRAATEPWRLDVPAPTIVCSDRCGTRAGKFNNYAFASGPDRLSDALFLALGWRSATVAECARGQGFPEGHPFQGRLEDKFRQAGNAVPRSLALVGLRAALATLDSK